MRHGTECRLEEKIGAGGELFAYTLFSASAGER
jgi:hypothetical protein